MSDVQSFNPRKVLDFVSDFQIRAQGIKRFEGNPYVEGDNIAEHLARLSRLLIATAPELKKEFPEMPSLIEDVLVTLLIHDDDEVIDGYDIPTALKTHNIKDQEEVIKFEESISVLGKEAKEYLGPFFSSFRKKDSLAAKIAKALDNIAGNQLVIEQKIGLINPDQARFAIEYAEKIKGVSETTDMLAQAQIDQIIETRKSILDDSEILKSVPQNAENLLKIDLFKHVLDTKKINIPLEQL